MSTVTKPIALDETLQSTNTALSSLGKDTTLQAIATAIANVGLSNIGNMSSLATTDKTSLVSAINEVVGDVSDLDTDKADKVASATNGNLAGLNASGNLTDSGWASDKTTTSASGNPISITGLKSNQLAVNPVITFEPIQAGSGDPSPSNVRAISGYDKIEVLSCGKNIFDGGYSESGKYLNQDGTLTNGSSWYVTNYIPVKSGISYTLSHSSTVSNNGICWYDENKAYINGALWGSANTKTITLPSNAKYIRASYYYNWVSTFQIEEGQTATTYEPCNKTTDLSEPLPQTVYSGSFNLRTGKFTIDKVKGIITSSATTSWASSYNGAFVTANVPYSIKAYGFNDTPNWICDKFKAYSRGGLQNATQGIAEYTDSSLKYLVKVSGVSNITDFNTWLFNNAPIEVVMELATPIEIQLTPHEISLLSNYAYVSTNGTSMSFDYHNGEIATLGDVAQLSESVENLKDYLGANNSKTGVSVSEYISTNPFICPYDGYVVVGSGSATSGTLRLQITGANGITCAYVYMLIAGANQVQSVFVKKGLRVFREQIVTGAWMSYIPIVP